MLIIRKIQDATVLVVMDVIAVTSSYFLAFFLKRTLILPDLELNFWLYLRLFAIELPFIMAVLVLSGLYSLNRWDPRPKSWFLSVLRSTLAASIVFLAVAFYLKLFSYSRAVFTIFFFLLPVGLLATRIFLHLFRRYSANGNPAGVGKVVLVTDDTTGSMEKWLTHMFSGPVVTHCVNGGGKESLMGGQLLTQGENETVLLDLSGRNTELIEDIMGVAEKEGIAVYLTPRFLPSGIYNMSWTNFGGLPLIIQRPPVLPAWGGFVKRLLDIVLASVGLIILSPLFLFVGLVIWMTSGRPVFYGQKRIGYGGRMFTIFKFRTMYEDAEKETGPVWTRKNDDRITPIGRILRRTNLDELPQFLNVILGHMSLVGPRPERPELACTFKEKIDRYNHKQCVKPGITGWAQINGLRGDTSLEKRIQYDLYYIENWSLWLDLKIILLTPLAGYRNAM